MKTFQRQVLKLVAKIVGWECSQKHVNCFDKGFKCFCRHFLAWNWPVPSPWEVLVGLALLNKAPKPQIETGSTIILWSFCKFSESQAPHTNAKPSTQTQNPLLKTFWRRFWNWQPFVFTKFKARFDGWYLTSFIISIWSRGLHTSLTWWGDTW